MEFSSTFPVFLWEWNWCAHTEYCKIILGKKYYKMSCYLTMCFRGMYGNPLLQVMHSWYWVTQVTMALSRFHLYACRNWKLV